MKPTSIADVIRTAKRPPIPASVTQPAAKPDVTAADIAAQPLAQRNPILGYILAASAKIHAKDGVGKAQAHKGKPDNAGDAEKGKLVDANSITFKVLGR